MSSYSNGKKKKEPATCLGRERQAIATMIKKRAHFLKYWRKRKPAAQIPIIDQRIEEIVEIERLLSHLWNQIDIDIRKNSNTETESQSQPRELEHTKSLAKRWLNEVMIPLMIAQQIHESPATLENTEIEHGDKD